ncbi:MAG: hypothetical protein PHQ43_00245 [Dehalococcoidales bacterium]|nr:hypothetical protein [Dehalococcoidales bacterium]
MTYTITFHHAKSPNLAFALKMARASQGFREEADLYHVEYDLAHFKDFVALTQTVGSWKNTEVVIDGDVVPQLSVWKFYRVVECYQNREKFQHKEFWCKVNDYGDDLIFPCKLLNLQYYLDQNRDWNRERILFEIERQLRGTMAWYCPMLDRSRIENLALEAYRQSPQAIRLFTESMPRF